MDEHDRFCMHLLAFDSDKPIGTCRIDLLQGRLAVLAPHRRHGIGELLMSHLIKLHKIKISRVSGVMRKLMLYHFIKNWVTEKLVRTSMRQILSM